MKPINIAEEQEFHLVQEPNGEFLLLYRSIHLRTQTNVVAYHNKGWHFPEHNNSTENQTETQTDNG